MSSLDLERPECSLGYTGEQLERILGDKVPEFNSWMHGQTVAVCDGRYYHFDLEKYLPSGCGPHGPVVYEVDLEAFLGGAEPLD